MDLYMHGCNCGSKRIFVNLIKKYCKENNIELYIYNSKYDEQARIEHSILLQQNNILNSDYPAITVFNNEVRTMEQWI